MIIVYRRSNGQVLNGHNTNSAFPDGGPADVAIQNAVSAHGGCANDYGIFRLHDLHDSAVVQATLSHDFSLVFNDAGEPTGVAIGQLRPSPPTPNPRMTEAERDDLMLAQSEMIAMLYEMVSGGDPQ